MMRLNSRRIKCKLERIKKPLHVYKLNYSKQRRVKFDFYTYILVINDFYNLDTYTWQITKESINPIPIRTFLTSVTRSRKYWICSIGGSIYVFSVKFYSSHLPNISNRPWLIILIWPSLEWNLNCIFRNIFLGMKFNRSRSVFQNKHNSLTLFFQKQLKILISYQTQKGQYQFPN